MAYSTETEYPKGITRVDNVTNTPATVIFAGTANISGIWYWGGGSGSGIVFESVGGATHYFDMQTGSGERTWYPIRWKVPAAGMQVRSLAAEGDITIIVHHYGG